MSFLDYVSSFNEVLWGPFILIPLLVGTGVFYTIRLGFVQKYVFRAFKQVFGNAFKGGKADSEGMSSFQALATAVAAQVGTGNLAGVATAIVAGGPGAIFWMWVSAIFGMGTNFAEAVLAQKYKTKVEGQVVGGPAYYISQGIKSKFLAGFFAVAIIFALGFMGNMVQSNSIVSTISHLIPGDMDLGGISMKNLLIGVAVAAMVGFIIIGGISRLASFTEKIVPVMALLYIIGGLVVIFLNYDQVIPAFESIFVGAFNPQALGGGLLGVTVARVIRFGVARGLFSNEAGMGSTPHAHAVAKVDHPVDQGMVALVGVTIDTLIICTLTALIILTSGALETGTNGAVLTQTAFDITMGQAGKVFLAVSLFFFALSTIIGWSFFAESNVRYLFGEKGVKPFKALVVIFVVVGANLEVDLVWQMADTLNGMMVFPNLIAILILSPQVVELVKDYREKDKLKVPKNL